MSNRISELENIIKSASKEYYDGSPIMSDAEFDAYVDELRHIDPTNKVINSVGWGSDSVSNKVDHKYGTVGSLNKIKTISSKYLTGYCASDKLDGMSCVAYYENGKLTKAVTRGNGSKGQDITDKFRMIDNTVLTTKDFTGGIRGELIISDKNWLTVHSSNPDIANSRNYVAGLINRQDVSSDLQYVDFVVYKIVGCDNPSVFTTLDDVDRFLSYNFNHVVRRYNEGTVNTYFKTDLDIYEFYKYSSGGYPRDGLVLTSTDLTYNEDTNAILYDEVAYKFQSEIANTTVTDIEWNLSRTGKIIPTVKIEPVLLSGAVIKRVTGFNARYIEDNCITKGTVISLMRSGEVIPDIQEVISTPTNHHGHYYIDRCPNCGYPVEYDGVNTSCKNPECIAQSLMKVKHFINSVTDVKGVGTNLLSDYLEYCNVTSIQDIPNKIINEVIDFSACPTKTKHKYEQLTHQLSSDIELEYGLAGLSIPSISWKSSRVIAKDLGSQFESIISDKMRLQGMLRMSLGPVATNSILSHYDEIKFLIDNFKIINSQGRDDCTEIESKGSVIITGKLSVTRSKFYDYVVSQGYSIATNVKSADYVICNLEDSTSSKYRDAIKYNKTILTDVEFMNIAGGSIQ